MYLLPLGEESNYSEIRAGEALNFVVQGARGKPWCAPLRGRHGAPRGVRGAVRAPLVWCARPDSCVAVVRMSVGSVGARFGWA